jgi:CheY-like chemotaxis protein
MALVLIVDDSEDLLDALQIALMDEGFDVAGAPNGQRGLELMRELHPDVILLDMMMPEMDGLEFLSRLSAEAAAPPVLANSGFEGFRSEALRRGALAFLVKPLSTEGLVGALRSAVERRPVSAALLAENAAGVEQARRLALEVSSRAVAHLDGIGMSGRREGLRRIVRWLPAYFGFGTCLVQILRGNDLCIEAIHNAPAGVHEGLRYPREFAYCDDVIASGSTLVLTDPPHHPSEHFSSHVEVEQGWRFYAGAPLTGPSGGVLGTLCLCDTSTHEFRSEDMRVLQALARGAAQGLETSTWPLDEDGAFGRDHWQLFVEVAVERAARPGGAGMVITAERYAPVPEATGLAVVGLDARRMALLWGGTGEWAPPEPVASHVLAKADLFGLANREAAQAAVRAMGP